MTHPLAPLPPPTGLYDPANEHDACGVGLVARLDGVPTHDIVTSGLTVLKRLMHRGATGNDPETGDGAGLLLRIPDSFFRALLPTLPPAGTYAVAMLFGGEGAEPALEAAAATEHFRILAWRDVPTDPAAIGPVARSSLPRIRQLFLAPDGRPSAGQAFSAPLERRLLILRRVLERAAPSAYICSCSARTIVYKGLLLATQIDRFYPDLADPAFASPFAIVHQRYSTNTFPSWTLAHPFRALAHNGEINALRGNLAALAAREPSLASPLFGDDIQKLLPVVQPGQSDSASLDNIYELLVAAGRDAPHAMLMLIPQAWGAKYHMPHDVRAFCEYHSALMEPWDGPAAVAFTDGLSLGAALDRNGLRPARWTLTRDGLFVLASEAGVLDIPPSAVARHGRLAPGSILWLDLATHRLREDAELKAYYARRRPYRRWIAQNHIPVTGLFTEVVPSPVPPDLPSLQRTFGWTLEDTETILRPMADTALEPVGAMGNDAALACLDPAPRTLFDHFHQLFAQVTNPPIDPIREELVMSIMTYIGNLPNILAETPAHARLIKLTRPVLTDDELRRLRSVPEYPAATLSLHFDGPLRPALDALSASALASVRAGNKILILSDRPAPDAPPRRLPSLLAVAAVHKTLSDAGLRPSVGLIVDSGEIREVHHLSVLLGFGATAACPWLALSTVTALSPDAPHRAAANYVTALCRGLMKTMSKMGISTLRSYRNARIYQAIGLGPTLLRDYFGSIPSPVSGLELPDLDRHLLPHGPTAPSRSPAAGAPAPAGGSGAQPPFLASPSLAPSGSAGAPPPPAHSSLFTFHSSLPPGGLYHLRLHTTPHLWTPQRLADLRLAVRTNNYALFKKFTSSIDNAPPITLRSLLTLRPAPSTPEGGLSARPGGSGAQPPSLATPPSPLPLDQVEPISAILPRLLGGAMSLGSLSPEAHETIALALNALGSMSNSGEGGEAPERYPTPANSAIKQVASARFGVTAAYLRSARDLQIKLAQGAKPGEGGHLPGHKVDALVGRLRHARPGTTLISPPPHHDIYSIEDLAQLVHDLKCVNPAARVSVKLVSETGVGTIAAGVAKAHADVIVISGFDGGTGAAPLSSRMHAGAPWEPGLAEAHQTLLLNNLRTRVRLQVDGQLRTARDIIIATILGADEYAFGTPMLVALGCVQCRHCNTNTCPVGIATQDPTLRAKFAGTPAHLQTYFRFLAQEIRETLATLGLPTLASARGRTDLLAPRPDVPPTFDFAPLLTPPPAPTAASCAPPPPFTPDLDPLSLLPEILPHLPPPSSSGGAGAEPPPAHSSLVTRHSSLHLTRPITNSHRSIGASLSGEIASRFGPSGLPDGALTIDFEGTAGQSFGAFLAHGITFNLRGAANDYLGKSLSGGTITVAPPPGATYPPETNTIAGNVVAYGATSGAIYLNGRAGERFGVRNSGATLVAEGVGDHALEYMTGGEALILGPTGINFGAGMTGGAAYVLDLDGDFDLRCNLDSVDLHPILPGTPEESTLLRLLRAHLAATSSPLAHRLLADWPSTLPLFLQVLPASP